MWWLKEERNMGMELPAWGPGHILGSAYAPTRKDPIQGHGTGWYNQYQIIWEKRKENFRKEEDLTVRTEKKGEARQGESWECGVPEAK